MKPSEETEDIMILSDEDIQKIKQGQKDYSEGKYIDNSVLNAEIEKWLLEESSDRKSYYK